MTTAGPRAPTEEQVLAWLDDPDGPDDYYGSDLNLQPEGTAILVRSRPGPQLTRPSARPAGAGRRVSPAKPIHTPTLPRQEGPAKTFEFTKLWYSWRDVFAAIGALTIFSLVAWIVLRALGAS
jgi:hypothetical protein